MSSMNFTCDSCGREVFGCTFVNGMKFCAKCYQETFGETDKDRKIADLEAKLAEKEKEIERLKIYDEYRFELPYPKVTILGKTFEDIQELIDKWIKQGSKDKISFTVEQLEKVRNNIKKVPITDYEPNEHFEKMYKSDAIRQIDNQIKEIKGDV